MTDRTENVLYAVCHICKVKKKKKGIEINKTHVFESIYHVLLLAGDIFFSCGHYNKHQSCIQD